MIIYEMTYGNLMKKWTVFAAMVCPLAQAAMELKILRTR